MNEFEKLDRSFELAKTSVSKLIVKTLREGRDRKMVETVGQALAELYQTQESFNQIKVQARFEQGFSDVLETAWRSDRI